MRGGRGSICGFAANKPLTLDRSGVAEFETEKSLRGGVLVSEFNLEGLNCAGKHQSAKLLLYSLCVLNTLFALGHQRFFFGILGDGYAVRVSARLA